MENLIYRHCMFCNGIFRQHKEIQKFCSDECRNLFTESREQHGNSFVGDPVTNTKTYTYKPSNKILEKYPLKHDKSYRYYQIIYYKPSKDGDFKILMCCFSRAKEVLIKSKGILLIYHYSDGEFIKSEELDLPSLEKLLLEQSVS